MSHIFSVSADGTSLDDSALSVEERSVKVIDENDETLGPQTSSQSDAMQLLHIVPFGITRDTSPANQEAGFHSLLGKLKFLATPVSWQMPPEVLRFKSSDISRDDNIADSSSLRPWKNAEAEGLPNVSPEKAFLHRRSNFALMNGNGTRDFSREIPLFTTSRLNSDHLLLSPHEDTKLDILKLLEQLMGSKDTSKKSDLKNAMNLSNDESDFRLLPELRFTLQRRGWKDFAPLSYYFTCDKCFVIHVEGKAQNRYLQELEAIARKYTKKYYPDHSCKIVTAGFGATACSSPEEASKLAISNDRIQENQLVGLHLQSDSAIYWISTAHGLEKVLANNPSLETLQGDPVSCTRCLPPNVSLSIGGATIVTCVCKSFNYFREFRQPQPGLSPSIDILLGPAPVLASDVTGEQGRERIAQMSSAGYLRPAGVRFVEYHITGVCGHSAVSVGGLNASPTLVYSSLIPGAPMTEGKVVTEVGDGGQILIQNLPRDAYGSGLLAVEPSREGQYERGHSGYIEPTMGHSGSAWCILDNRDGTPSCKVFAITVAIADNFCGSGRNVWLISDLKVSLDDIVLKYPNHFDNSDRGFQCISRGSSSAIGRFISLRPETL